MARPITSKEIEAASLFVRAFETGAATLEEDALSLCLEAHILLCQFEPHVAFEGAPAVRLSGVRKLDPNPLLNLTAYKFRILRSS